MAKKFELFSMKYEELQYTAAGTVVAGSFITRDETNGFTLVDVVSGDKVTLVTKAEKVKVEVAAVTIVSGEAAYWDSSANNVTNVVGSNTLVGHFVRDAASADTHGFIKFDGALAFAKA